MCPLGDYVFVATQQVPEVRVSGWASLLPCATVSVRPHYRSLCTRAASSLPPVQVFYAATKKLRRTFKVKARVSLLMRYADEVLCVLVNGDCILWNEDSWEDGTGRQTTNAQRVWAGVMLGRNGGL